MRDEITKLTKSYVVHQFNCSSCNASYTGKSESNLYTRIDDHAFSDKESAIYNHRNNCTYSAIFKHIFRFNNDSTFKTLFNILKH